MQIEIVHNGVVIAGARSEAEAEALLALDPASTIGEVLPPPPPDRVTARQFKLQLLDAGLIDAVEAWIATQERAVQIAYETSGTFVREDPMMQAGFAALGYSPAQVEEFFSAAAAR